MKKEPLKHVGKLCGAHKLQGEMKLELFPAFTLKVKLPKTIFIGNSEKEVIPYFTKSLRPAKPGQFLICVDEITTPEKAQLMSNKKVWLPAKQVKSAVVEIDDTLVGYMVHDASLGKLGKVESVMKLPAQILITFTYKGKEILLPCTPATIMDIDDDEQTVTVQLIDGLLEVYM